MAIDPYLNFDGRCEEAIEFYKKALGAEVAMLLRFSGPTEARSTCRSLKRFSHRASAWSPIGSEFPGWSMFRKTKPSG